MAGDILWERRQMVLGAGANTILTELIPSSLEMNALQPKVEDWVQIIPVPDDTNPIDAWDLVTVTSISVDPTTGKIQIVLNNAGEGGTGVTAFIWLIHSMQGNGVAHAWGGAGDSGGALLHIPGTPQVLWQRRRVVLGHGGAANTTVQTGLHQAAFGGASFRAKTQVIALPPLVDWLASVTHGAVQSDGTVVFHNSANADKTINVLFVAFNTEFGPGNDVAYS